MITNPAIRVITTGGTIDKVYDAVTQENVFDGKTSVPDMLETAANMAIITVDPLLQRDSIYMTDDERKQIADECARVDESLIVITHGLDTMIATAKVIAEAHVNKTIILTGATRPHSLPNSDAAANLNASLMAAQLAPPNVYICMNGLLFTWDNVRKDEEYRWFTLRSE